MSIEDTGAHLAITAPQISNTHLEVKQRIIDTFPHLAKEVDEYSTSLDATKAPSNEKTNALLILEKVIADELLDITQLSVSIVLAVASIGLRSEEITAGEPVGVIDTEEQLASDVAVAVFVTRYCFLQKPSIRKDRKFLHDVKVEDGPEGRSILAFTNSYLPALLRENPDKHSLIGDYLTERGIEPESEKAVMEIREYLELTESGSSVLAHAWL